MKFKVYILTSSLFFMCHILLSSEKSSLAPIAGGSFTFTMDSGVLAHTNAVLAETTATMRAAKNSIEQLPHALAKQAPKIALASIGAAAGIASISFLKNGFKNFIGSLDKNPTLTGWEQLSDEQKERRRQYKIEKAKVLRKKSYYQIIAGALTLALSIVAIRKPQWILGTTN